MRGLAFDIETGLMATPNEEEYFAYLVFDLLSTKKGSRFFNREYGSKLHLLEDTPCDEVSAKLAESYIRDSIAVFMPDVKILAIDIKIFIDNLKIILSLQYNSSLYKIEYQ